MYSIKNLCYSCLVILTISSCLSSGISREEYFEQCPYETKSVFIFQLQAPLEIYPQKKTYQVGDTITWRLALTDSIFDYNRDLTFEIRDFPFQPFFHLYRVEDSNWTSGFLDVGIIIDSVYQYRFVGGSSFATSLRGTSTYIDGNYLFEFKTILNRPGRYINYMVDNTWTLSDDDIMAGLHPEYSEESVFNSSGCPDPDYAVSYLYQGDPYYDDFQDEILFLDKEVYSDSWYSRDNLDIDKWGNRSEISIEWHGVFGFEVVE